MSGYFAISRKKQQKSNYNLCKHQCRGNLKIKNSWISAKGLVGIEIKLSQKNLLSFLDDKPLPELLKTFSSIWSIEKIRVICPTRRQLTWCVKRMVILAFERYLAVCHPEEAYSRAARGPKKMSAQTSKAIRKKVRSIFICFSPLHCDSQCESQK